MSAAPDARERAPGAGAAFEADLDRMAKLVREALGIDLRPFKSTIVRHRLAGRIRELGLPGLGAYLDLLEDPGATDERDRLISAITTNVTQFFRERHHFDALEREVLPDLLARARAGGRVRLWSAACSTGQEPYSIAACILSLCPEAPRLDVRILATDVDAEVLSQARRAAFAEEEVGQLPRSRRFVLFGDSAKGGEPTIRDEVSALVAFNRLNLVDPWPMRQPFDVIFCRNVAIYLDADVRERLWRRLVATLREGGYLFVGHAERIQGPALAHLDHAGVTTYRKRSGPSAQQSGH